MKTSENEKRKDRKTEDKTARKDGTDTEEELHESNICKRLE